MPAEIVLPVHVRVGGSEARWGTVAVPVADGEVGEAALRHALADFLHAAADCLKDPDLEDENVEVPDAAPE